MPSVQGAEIRVAVIGAGVSGLRCADLLLQAGATVKIFEARNRIGGRVHQIRSHNHLVDLGANWIHSTNGNPILQLAEETKTQLFWRPTTQAVVGSGGTRRDMKTAKRLKETLWAYVEQADNYSAHQSSEIDPQRSLMDYLVEHAKKDFEQEPAFLQDFLNEAQRWGQFIGEPVSRQSLRFLCMEEGPGGTDTFIASTYKDILAYIAKRVVELDVISFNSEVKRISTRTAHEGTPALVKIETTDGSCEEFNEVVVSCPLGWLKKHKETAFSPPLPAPLRAAIDNTGYGRLEKIYLTFPNAFWLKASDEFQNASEPQYPCFTHFHDPEYGNNPLELPSNVILISLAHLPGESAHPTLLMYIHGDCGNKIVQSIKDLEPGSERYNKSIDEFARPYYSRLPNYSDENHSCRPISHFCSAWQLDPLAGNGSYSYVPTSTLQADRDNETLSEGCGLGESRGIWFIGEHTAPSAYTATTTGAYISGERMAARICKKFGLELPSKALDPQLGV